MCDSGQLFHPPWASLSSVTVMGVIATPGVGIRTDEDCNNTNLPIGAKYEMTVPFPSLPCTLLCSTWFLLVLIHILKVQAIQIWSQKEMHSLGVTLSSPFIEHQLVLAVLLSALCNRCHCSKQFSFFHSVMLSCGSSESEEEPCPLGLKSLHIRRGIEWSHWGEGTGCLYLCTGCVCVCGVHLGDNGYFFCCTFDVLHLRF